MAAPPTISGVTPDSTTAQLAARVPLEEDSHPATIQSAGPLSSTAELAAKVPREDKATIQSAAPNGIAELAGKAPLERPTPANESVPGFFPQTPQVEKPNPTSPETPGKEPTFSVNPVPAGPNHPSPPSDEPTFSVNPLPAGPNIKPAAEPIFSVNPLPAGPNIKPTAEPTFSVSPLPAGPNIDPAVEPTFSVSPLPAFDTAENPIKLAPGEPIPHDVTGHTLTSNVTLDEASYEQSDRGAFGVGIPDQSLFQLPPVGPNTIPESSLPILNAAVPEVVKESQEKAHADAEASAVPQVVARKASFEDEIKKTVSAAPGVVAVPDIVKTSNARAGEEAIVVEAVEAKKEFEQQLKEEVDVTKPVELADTSAAAPIPEPKDTIAVPVLNAPKEATPTPTPAPEKVDDTPPPPPPAPKEATPVAPKDTTPAAVAPATNGTTNGHAAAKKKRNSFIARIKEKIKAHRRKSSVTTATA